LTRSQFLAALLALSMAVGCKAQPSPAPPQSAPQGSPDLTLNRRIEILIRAQLSIPQDYAITLGARTPSKIPGYDALPVTLSASGQTEVVDLMISTDNKTLARLDTYSLTNYPLFNVDDRPIRGNPAAKVTVISFDDLECPYCSVMHQTLFPATQERYKDTVRFVYKDFPLVEIHPWAMRAAVDANCLAAQSGGVYWAYVDYIHAHSEEINGQEHSLAKSFDALNRIARQEASLGKLDAVKLDACLARQDEIPVRASMREAQSLGLEGAPALFVDGTRIGGAVPEARVWMVIDRALRAAGVVPPATPARPTQPAQTKTLPAPPSQ
jgi:protein-disulfide isomerase